jgi:hypothetical protein
MRTIYNSVFHRPEIINELHRLHDNYVLFPADKASETIVFVKVANTIVIYMDLDLHNICRESCLYSMKFSVLNAFNFPKNQDKFKSRHLYWIPKLHKNIYKDTLFFL